MLSERIRKTNLSTGSYTRNKSLKPLTEYSESHKRHLKRTRTQACEMSLSWLEKEGLIPISIQVHNRESGKTVTVSLVGQIPFPCLALQMIPLKSIWQLTCYCLSKISGEAYHELASICKVLPQHYEIKQRITELNRLWNIKPTQHGTIGLQQSLRG